MPSFTRAWLLSLALSSAASAAPQRVFDRVVAIVDHEPILASELAERVKVTLDQAPRDNEIRYNAFVSQASREMLERMIEETLVAREAARLKVTVTSEEIDQAVQAVLDKNGLDRAGVERELLRLGLTEGAWRELLRAQILEGKLLRLVLAAKRDSDTSEENVGRVRKEWLAKPRERTYVEVRL